MDDKYKKLVLSPEISNVWDNIFGCNSIFTGLLYDSDKIANIYIVSNFNSFILLPQSLKYFVFTFKMSDFDISLLYSVHNNDTVLSIEFKYKI